MACCNYEFYTKRRKAVQSSITEAWCTRSAQRCHLEPLGELDADVRSSLDLGLPDADFRRWLGEYDRSLRLLESFQLSVWGTWNRHVRYLWQTSSFYHFASSLVFSHRMIFSSSFFIKYQWVADRHWHFILFSCRRLCFVISKAPVENTTGSLVYNRGTGEKRPEIM